jgi:hypothetical protein
MALPLDKYNNGPAQTAPEASGEKNRSDILEWLRPKTPTKFDGEWSELNLPMPG